MLSRELLFGGLAATEVVADFTGSAPQAKGPMNNSRTGLVSLVGGWGAGISKDGESGQFSATDGETYNTPVEITEDR